MSTEIGGRSSTVIPGDITIPAPPGPVEASVPEVYSTKLLPTIPGI